MSLNNKIETDLISSKQAHSSYEVSIQERIKELKSQGIEYILYAIYEKQADHTWTRFTVLIESRNAVEKQQESLHTKKAEQYKSWGRVVLVSGGVIAEMAGAGMTQGLPSGLFQILGKGMHQTDNLFFGDGRTAKITLLDSSSQMQKEIFSDLSQSLHKQDTDKAYSAWQRLSDTFQRNAQMVTNN